MKFKRVKLNLKILLNSIKKDYFATRNSIQIKSYELISVEIFNLHIHMTFKRISKNYYFSN